MRRAAALMAMVGLSLGLAACDGSDPEPDESESSSGAGGDRSVLFDADDVVISYHFTDASVQPDTHRSFELQATAGTGTVTVSAYGDTLDTVESDVDPAAIEGLLTAFETGDLDAIFHAPEIEACDGGTSYFLKLMGVEHSVSARVDVCGGDGRDLAEQLVTAMQPLLEPFDIEDLTDGRYP